jgi:UrcA family protein
MLIAATAALANTILVGGAFAQTAAAPTMPEVSVQASRVTSTTVGQTATGTPGVPINNVSLSYGVSTAGLDLSSQSGKQELQKLVNKAATAACKELGRQFPNSTTSDAECIKAATNKAMVQIQQLEAAATKK